jgi:hypothetical protein
MFYMPRHEVLLFATVPESSINSWDSWFIFNLGYLLLEAPREYVQHGPLVSIN